MVRAIGAFGLAAGAAVLMTACTGTSGKPVPRPTPPKRSIAFTVDHPTEPAFDPVDVRLSGLKPGEHVTVTSTATDLRSAVWTGVGKYTADASGVVDLAKQPSTGGTYTGVDGSGLLWSMNPPAGSKEFGYIPSAGTGFDVTLTAVGEGSAGGALLTRESATPGVTVRSLTLVQDQVVGKVFLPAGISSAKPRPAVLVFGGSEGGESQDLTASVLASEGYPAMSIAYFGAPGLPATLADVPLEYFEHAATDLSNEPGVDRSRIFVEGGSRGSEAALLAAQNYPEVIHGVIVTSPSSQVYAGYPDGTKAAWTLLGTPIPVGTAIPVDHIAGPVLVFAGADDALWPSAVYAGNLSVAFANAHNPFPYKVTVYPGAGHMSDSYPTLPVMTTETEASSGVLKNLGGTRQADAAAQADTWQQILTLLK